MINLLSPDYKKQLTAARSNTLLLRYTLLLGALVVVLIGQMGWSYYVLKSEDTRNRQLITDNELSTSSYNATKNEAASFSSNLVTAKYILDQQVPYTAILLKLAAVLPPESTFERIAIDPSSFGTPTTLTIHTTSYEKAVGARASLQNSKIFSDVSFQSVSQSTESGAIRPFTATYQVTYSKDLLKQL